MFLEHSRSLAMVSTCKAIDIFEMRWSPSTFSWSCLKPPGFDLKEVSVVSPLVEEAVVQYTLENPNYRLDVVSIDFLLGVGRAYTKLTGGLGRTIYGVKFQIWYHLGELLKKQFYSKLGTI